MSRKSELHEFIRLAELLQKAAELAPEVRASIADIIHVVSASAGSGPSQVLHIASDATWFQWGRAPSVHIGHRPHAQRVLLALARNHLQNGTHPLSVIALRDAGWPGEVMLLGAARNRVHVTLTYLRRVGLRHAIIRRGRGYLFRSGLDVRLFNARGSDLRET